MHLAPERQPEDEKPFRVRPYLADHRGQMVANRPGIGGRELVPFRMQRLHGFRTTPGIEYLGVRALAVMAQKEEGLAEMKDALHAQPELANAGGIGGLAVLAEGADA